MIQKSALIKGLLIGRDERHLKLLFAAEGPQFP